MTSLPFLRLFGFLDQHLVSSFGGYLSSSLYMNARLSDGRSRDSDDLVIHTVRRGGTELNLPRVELTSNLDPLGSTFLHLAAPLLDCDPQRAQGYFEHVLVVCRSLNQQAWTSPLARRPSREPRMIRGLPSPQALEPLSTTHVQLVAAQRVHMCSRRPLKTASTRSRSLVWLSI